MVLSLRCEGQGERACAMKRRTEATRRREVLFAVPDASDENVQSGSPIPDCKQNPQPRRLSQEQARLRCSQSLSQNAPITSAAAGLNTLRMASPTCIEILPGVWVCQMHIEIYSVHSARSFWSGADDARQQLHTPLFLISLVFDLLVPSSIRAFLRFCTARTGNLYLAASGKEGLAELKLLLQQHIVSVRAT